MERLPCARAATGTMNPSRRARRFTILLVPMVIGAYAGIAAATTAPSTGNTRATAVFLGDSNEVLSGTDLAVSLLNRDNGYIVVEVARPGATIRFGDCTQRTTCTTYDYWQSRVVDTLAAVQPDVWVVDLGINDANRPGTPTSPGYSNYGAKIDWLMNLLGSTPVVWTNLPCKIEHKRPENRMQADQSGACRYADATPQPLGAQLGQQGEPAPQVSRPAVQRSSDDSGPKRLDGTRDRASRFDVHGAIARGQRLNDDINAISASETVLVVVRGSRSKVVGVRDRR